MPRDRARGKGPQEPGRRSLRVHRKQAREAFGLPRRRRRGSAMLQEDESGEKEGKMPNGMEFYLESLLIDAFKGRGFQKINEMVQENNIFPPQKFNNQLLNQLDKVLKKELDKNEFSNVSLLLKCIQLYSKSDPKEGVKQLLQQRLIPKMVTWFERTRGFLSLIEPEENAFLVKLVEDFLDTTLVISRSNSEGKKQLLESFIPYLGHLATESNISCALQQETLRTLNNLLMGVTQEERKKFAVSEEMCLIMKELAKRILNIGDYDIQVTIMEALFRLMLKNQRDELAHTWFEDQHIAKAFKKIRDRHFETDIRKFLNELNDRLGDKKRVCSIPCRSVRADSNTLNKPPDDRLEEFWIDFNFGTESITFYLDDSEGNLWESVRLSKEDVSNYCLQEEGGEKILKIFLKSPTVINNKEITKIKIHFDTQLDISTPLHNVMGNDKMMVPLDKEDDSHNANQPQHNTTVVSTHVKETEDSVSVDSLSDILTSQQSEQSIATTTQITIPPLDVPPDTESQKTGRKNSGEASSDVAVASLMHSANTLKFPSPNTSILKDSPLKQNCKTIEPSGEGESGIRVEEILPLEDGGLEKKNRARSPSKEIAETKKDPYEFELSSDPAAHEMVSTMKEKVFILKTTQKLQRSSEKGNLQLSKSQRRLSTSYKNHLFSEHSQETPGNSSSENSWLLGFQNKSVPKTLNYTRKRPRVRSNLKVLPLSSPSSDSDHHAKNVGISAPYREKEKRKTEHSSTEMHNLTALPPPGITSTPLSHIRKNALEMVDDTLPLNSHFSPSNSDVGERTKYVAALSTLPLKNNISISKRKLSDLSVDLNRKLSKCTERISRSDQSPSFQFEPRRLFNSTEVEEETPKGQPSDELNNDVLFMKTLEEENDDFGVIAAFENFTSELKKTFWSRHKKMETYTQNILKPPGHSLSDLLSQIHQSRMNGLENFHKTVVQELTNLEKRTQFLLSLEKDTVKFWTEQCNTLNSQLNGFCSHQMQRMQSMDSVLDESTRNLNSSVQNLKCHKGVDDKEERDKIFVVTSDQNSFKEI